MLVISRTKDEAITIAPADDLDPSTPIGEVFNTLIKITLNKVAKQVTVGIEAPASLTVLREEITA